MQQMNVNTTSSRSAGARVRKSFTVLLLLVCAFAVSGCARTVSCLPNFIVDAIPGLPELKVQGMVARAIDIHNEEGAAAAVAAVQNTDDFLDGSYYVLIFDTNTYKILASRAHPESVDLDLRELKEPGAGGRDNLRHLVDDATTEGGWIRWQYFNPLTKKPQTKKGWAVRVGDRIYAAAIYVTE